MVFRSGRDLAAWIQAQAKKHYVADGPIDLSNGPCHQQRKDQDQHEGARYQCCDLPG